MLLCCWMCGLGTRVLPAVLCLDLHQGCLFLFEIIISGGSWRPQCLQSHRHLCTGQSISLCSHSHQSVPTLFIRAITGSTAAVDHFWDVNVPNGNEISHHIQKLPYASCDAPSTSGTHFLVISLSLMAAQPCCQQVKKGHSTCFNLNPDECVQPLSQSVTEWSHSGKLFFSLIAGDIP